MNGRTMRLAAAVAVVALQLQPRMVAIAAAPCSVNFADDEDFVHTKLVVPAPDSSEAPPLGQAAEATRLNPSQEAARNMCR